MQEAGAGDPDILPQATLRKYITYAKQTCKPKLQNADYDKIAAVPPSPSHPSRSLNQADRRLRLLTMPERMLRPAFYSFQERCAVFGRPKPRRVGLKRCSRIDHLLHTHGFKAV